LFEYLYKSDRLILIPHIPPGMDRLEQKDPIRFGSKRLTLSTIGQGHVTAVEINGQVWTDFDGEKITLPYDQLQAENQVVITLGYPKSQSTSKPTSPPLAASRTTTRPTTQFADQSAKLKTFLDRLNKLGESHGYEAAHARLALRSIEVIAERKALQQSKQITPLPDATAQKAAEQLYLDTAKKLYDGLELVIAGYAKSPGERKQKIARLWTAP
jgi:hypothetical protein